MADKKSDKKTNQTTAAEPRKKADIILERIDYLLSSSNEMVNRVDKSVASTNYISRQNSEIYEKTLEENANLRQQIKYLAAQSQNVFDKMSAMIGELSDKVNGLQQTIEKSSKLEMPASFDYDAVAEAVAARIDLEELAKDVAELIDINGLKGDAEDGVLYEAEEIPEDEAEEEDAYGIDYDLIADKVAERLIRSISKSEDGEITMSDVKEEISADYIATRVAEQIIIPDPDYDMIADAVFERFYQDDETPETDDDGLEDGVEEYDDGAIEEEYIPTEDELAEFAADENALPEYAPVDYEKIASLVVEKLVESDEEYADAEYDFDYEKLADLVAERVFRDDGQGEEIEEEETVEFDYDKLAEAIASKITITEAPDEADESGENSEAKDSVKLTEETLAQIVDEISKRVCEYLPTEYDIVVDDDGCAAIAEVIHEKLSAANENGELDIVIDEDGVDDISSGVAEKVIEATDNRIAETEEKLSDFEQTAEARFDKIETDVNEIKELLKNGVPVIASDELAAAEAVAEINDEQPEPAPEEEAEDGESGLVTVSDVIGDEIPEVVEGVVEFIEEPETDVVIEEIVSDIDEQPVEGEVMPDGLDDAAATVDFANMMKYNRSFIARIIQGSDEVKTYYGQTKTALLSYKKVNSSVAWGAERFNKGRETIAKFKIRGKTLCLYLALDPKEYPVSVYHQVDVSDNKSMATTPMMVKIKSPRGVKKAIRLIDEMLEKRGAVKQNVVERDYVAMYPYETIEELIDDGLVKDVSKNK